MIYIPIRFREVLAVWESDNVKKTLQNHSKKWVVIVYIKNPRIVEIESHMELYIV